MHALFCGMEGVVYMQKLAFIFFLFECPFSQYCWLTIPISVESKPSTAGHDHEPTLGSYLQGNLHYSLMDNLDLQECSYL